MRKPTWFPWPPVMIIFLTNVLLGCFGYFALRTVLVLFLKRVLGFSETGATKVYHAYAWLACFTPIGAAIIADSISGKWKTLICAGFIYVVGKFLLTVSAVPAVGHSAVALGILALVLMAFAAGGGAACTNALVGDQFKLPEQSHGMALYYSFAYWLANVTIFASIFVAPKFREVQCFEHDCYALNFSIATVLTLLTTCLLFVGKRWFVIKAPTGNVVVEVTKCITHAISRKRSLTEEVAKKHWLDYADDKFDLQLIKDIKQLLQLCILFIPLPLYWALFEQQYDPIRHHAIQVPTYQCV